MLRLLSVFCLLVFGLAGCTSSESGAIKMGKLPTARTGLPLPEKRDARATFDVPAGWRVEATRNTPYCDADYVLKPTMKGDDVYIALQQYPHSPERTEREDVDGYLSGIWDAYDDNVSVRKIGNVDTRLGRIGLYLYYSSYWRYRIAAMFRSGTDSYMVEMYAPTDKLSKEYMPVLKEIVESVRMR